ncbi:hypothetical protein CIB48_g5444 [Xylaria polymorpha]|nr:hypothetical protein CIB48_g5444 [Xylaria polymorpha]
MFLPEIVTAGYLLAIRCVRITTTFFPTRVIQSPTNPANEEEDHHQTEANRLLTSSATVAAGPYRAGIEPAAGDKRPHHHHTTTASLTSTPTQSHSSSSSSSQTLPGSCYTTWDDLGHTTATVKAHSCYTRTSLVPPGKLPLHILTPQPLFLDAPISHNFSTYLLLQTNPLSIVPNTLVLPAVHGPGMSAVHQGVEHHGAVRDTTAVRRRAPCTASRPPLSSSSSSGSSAPPACPTCEVCPIPVEWVTYTTGCVGTPTITEVNTVTPA